MGTIQTRISHPGTAKRLLHAQLTKRMGKRSCLDNYGNNEVSSGIVSMEAVIFSWSAGSIREYIAGATFSGSSYDRSHHLESSEPRLRIEHVIAYVFVFAHLQIEQTLQQP